MENNGQTLDMKQGFDFAVATICLAMTTPLLIVIAIVVRLETSGPIIYRAVRVGRGGREFEVLKFRTMRADSTVGPAITVRDDPRITRSGKVLRRWRLDELPQLINVLRGEMSLVGPRPEDPIYVVMYRLDDRALISSVRPGITGLAQLMFHDEASMIDPDQPEVYENSILPRKVKVDRYYAEKRSMSMDLGILMDTLTIAFDVVIFSRRHLSLLYSLGSASPEAM